MPKPPAPRGLHPRRSTLALLLAGPLTATAVGLVACGGDGEDPADTILSVPQDPALVAKGKDIFRYETFGDEARWTDQLQMHQVIATIAPLTAASVGLKIDADALPANVVQGMQDGSIRLDDPQTTLALLSLNAVIGAKGEVVKNADGHLELKRFGITCALCHSTVSRDVHVLAGGTTDLAGIVGHRLDGSPNRDLNPGAIIALSPVLDESTVKLLNSWGPGKYDARWNLDGKSEPAVIPPAYGLSALKKAIFTGDGDIEHEPAGPVAYWNRYVSVTQMGGQGAFSDRRLPWTVDNTHGGKLPDLVTDKLPALQAYQYSLQAPPAPTGSFDVAAAQRGRAVFNGAARCASCHTGALFTDATRGTLHDRSASASKNPGYADRSATKQWRVTPLRGIWEHAPYFHDGSAATLADVVDAYDQKDKLGLTSVQKTDLVEFLKSL